MTAITLTLNGTPLSADVEPRQHLGDFLREEMLLTATHLGCEHGVCGACTVLIDGQPARSCIAFPVALDGAEITTLEGLAEDPIMARLRNAFSTHHALQCGYCTPGMLIMARDIVLRRPGADETTIRHELAGNLCRCTGYMGIVAAIREVALERSALEPVVTRGLAGPSVTADPFLKAPGRSAAPVKAKPTSSAEPVASTALEPLVNPVELTQSFVVPATQDVVFAHFQDPAEVIACLPGARLTAPSDGRTLAAELSIKLGPIKASFAGTGAISADPVTRSGVIEGRGLDGKSATRVRARLNYRLDAGADEGTTLVTVDVAYVLQGPLAQVSRGAIAQDLAKGLTHAFAVNFSARLAGSTPTIKSLDIGGLALKRLKAWVMRLFGASR